MKSFRGFTLIELLVVIAMIGLLSSVILASLSSARAKSRDARRVSDMKQIMTAMQLYQDTNGAYPASSTYMSCTYPAYGGGPNVCGANSGNTTWTNGTATTSLSLMLSPYISKLPVDPLNVWPFTYYYWPNGTDGCSTTLPSIWFTSEVNSYSSSYKVIDTNTNGNSKERYCLVLP